MKSHNDPYKLLPLKKEGEDTIYFIRKAHVTVSPATDAELVELTTSGSIDQARVTELSAAEFDELIARLENA